MFCNIQFAIAPSAWWHYALCGMVGLLCAYFIVLITQYYTDYTNSPVKKIAAASRTGHGTNIIAGIAVGMESTAFPAITISISLLCATMCMLCTAVFVLSMNNFGPIADNAGGVVEMNYKRICCWWVCTCVFFII